MRRNRGFDGQVAHKIEDGVVAQRKVVTDRVTDTSPLRAMTGLITLDFRSRTERDAAILRAITTLETINGKRGTAFWKEVDDGSTVVRKDSTVQCAIGRQNTERESKQSAVFFRLRRFCVQIDLGCLKQHPPSGIACARIGRDPYPGLLRKHPRTSRTIIRDGDEARNRMAWAPNEVPGAGADRPAAAGR